MDKLYIIIKFISFLPKSPKFIWISLPIWICLKNVICIFLYCISILGNRNNRKDGLSRIFVTRILKFVPSSIITNLLSLPIFSTTGYHWSITLTILSCSVTRILKFVIHICFKCSVLDANTPFRLMSRETLKENI